MDLAGSLPELSKPLVAIGACVVSTADSSSCSEPLRELQDGSPPASKSLETSCPSPYRIASTLTAAPHVATGKRERCRTICVALNAVGCEG